jgi:uracil-DNA glycosylase
MIRIGNDWDERLAGEWDKPYYTELRSFLANEYREQTIYPPAEDVFNALRYTSYEDVKVVILGQDPYHEPGQAQGLAFSVPRGVQPPPSLVNIMKELADDTGIRPGSGGPDMAERGADGPAEGVLVPWARHGVLLLNTVLTVRAHSAGSHRGKGWEQFTDRVIELLAMRERPMVFVLWGANARAKRDLIIRSQGGRLRHLIIEAPHPSPLSAHRGFFGGRYFSRCNYFLRDNDLEPVDWRI